MTAEFIPNSLRYWSLIHDDLKPVNNPSVLKRILIESCRLMKLLMIIDLRWTRGNTCGKILYRRKLDEARDDGQQLWAHLKRILRETQDLAFLSSGGEATIWISVGRGNCADGKAFFECFNRNSEIRPLLREFKEWNDACQVWIPAAEPLSTSPRKRSG